MFNYLLGIISGICLISSIKTFIIAYKKYKLSKSLSELKKTILDIKKKTQLDSTSIDFIKRKHEIASKNKSRLVKSKIDQLERINIHKQLAQLISEQLIIGIANQLVEKDRINGKIDDLYKECEE